VHNPAAMYRIPLKQRALEKLASEVELRVSSLGSEAGALGAARLVSERILESVSLAS